LVLIDHQPFQFANLNSHEPTVIVNNVIGLAKTAAEFLQRLGTRQQDRDLPATQETIVAQVTAITKWGMAPKPTSLDSLQHPVLVANGDTDLMVPSINSVELARKLPHSQLSIFPDAGHGAIFQYHSAFLDQTLRFLQN